MKPGRALRLPQASQGRENPFPILREGERTGVRSQNFTVLPHTEEIHPLVRGREEGKFFVVYTANERIANERLPVTAALQESSAAVHSSHCFRSYLTI